MYLIIFVLVTGLQFLNNEGSALYVTQSKINHSCVPNAQPTFPHSNHILALSAVGDIAAGEEICISYLDECSLERSRHSRQKVCFSIVYSLNEILYRFFFVVGIKRKLFICL